MTLKVQAVHIHRHARKNLLHHATNMEWSKFFIYLDVAAPLLTLLAAVTTMFIKTTRPAKVDLVVLFFLTTQVALNGLANALQYNYITNHWVYILNSFITQFIFSAYFYRLFEAKIKKAVVISFLAYSCFLIFNLAFIQPYNTFNSYSYALGAFIIVLFGLISFLSWTDIIPGVDITNLKEFWASAGILVYFGSSFFIFISYHYLSIVSYYSVGTLWRLHNIFLALGCILFFKAMICNKWILK